MEEMVSMTVPENIRLKRELDIGDGYGNIFITFLCSGSGI